MQYERTPLNRLFAFIDTETHHRFRCFGCKRDVLVRDRGLEDARMNGCDRCGETLIPHEQSTGLCCPGCPAELVSQGEPHRADVLEQVFAFECDYCETTSVWALGAAPVGIRIDRDPEELPKGPTCDECGEPSSSGLCPDCKSDVAMH